MEEVVKSLALVVGTVALVVPTVAAFINQSRLFRAAGDHLTLKVHGKVFVFDVNSFEGSDVKSIDSATQAVEEKAELHA